MRFGINTAILGGLLLASTSIHAQEPAPSFTDVPADHYAYQAIEYLKSQDYISGYEDGTFRPEQSVNRAEAMKFIIAPLVPAETLTAYTASPFEDVPEGAWFLPYIEYGRENGVVDGPPVKPNFLGANPVIKVEFLKMLLLANQIDPNSYSEIRLPLADDVTNPDEWYYPYLRYAVTASMTMVSQEEGTFKPGRNLTRADTAALLYRFLMYQQGRRTQALLSESETEILVILGSLERNDIVQAEYASARALLAARGAHASKPDIPVVQGALKITEAFRALVRAYRAGVNNDYDEVIRLAGDAWHLSESAREKNEDMGTLSEQVQKIAQNMADSARSLMTQGGGPAEPADAE